MSCVGDPEFVEHVGADTVGTEHDAIAPRCGRCVADRVVHVASRVVGDRAANLTIEVHAVHQEPVVVDVPVQPCPGICVAGAFGHVDMHTTSELLCCRGDRLKGFVGARECGMHTDITPTAGFEEAHVLVEPALRRRGHRTWTQRRGRLVVNRNTPRGRVTVRDPVGAAHPHADFGAGFRNHVEASFDRVR